MYIIIFFIIYKLYDYTTIFLIIEKIKKTELSVKLNEI